MPTQVAVLAARIAVLASIIVLAHPAGSSAQPSLAGELESASRHQVISRMIQQAGMSQMLSGQGPFTLFAPTDAAFAALPAAAVDAILADPSRMRRLVSLHLFRGNVSPDVWATQPVEAPIRTANGWIRPLDRLIPEYVVSASRATSQP